MNCPKCGHQNPDDAQICQICNFSLTNPDERQLKPKVKTSKLAILSLVLGIFSLYFFVFTGVPAIIIGIISYRKIKYSDGKLAGKPFSIVGMILPIPLMFIFSIMCTFCVLWCLDAPPIPNDYTITDLRSAPVDCAASYQLLKILTDPNYNLIERSPDSNTPEIGLSWEDFNIINEISYAIDKGDTQEISELLSDNADIIQQAWVRTEKAREIIGPLNEFPEIADLYEPSLTTKSIKMFPLIHLSKLYKVYAYLQTEPEDIQKITTELIKLDSVIRKLSLNARLLVIKLCCHVIMSNNIQTANDIANNPGTPQESIELLAEHFKPLTKEQMSFKNPLLFEYLFMKEAVYKTPDEIPLRMTPLFKKNSILRIYRNHCEDLINTTEDINDTSRERLAVWPSCYHFKEPAFPKKNERMPFLYRCYNPAGSIFLIMINLDIFQKMPEEILRITGQSDLLQIVLNKRLGKDVKLKARAYSDQYIIDIENKIIFSPGPDGEAGTKDDIKLPINPEVLGLTE